MDPVIVIAVVAGLAALVFCVVLFVKIGRARKESDRKRMEKALGLNKLSTFV